jgi:hypothetical protein
MIGAQRIDRDQDAAPSRSLFPEPHHDPVGRAPLESALDFKPLVVKALSGHF